MSDTLYLVCQSLTRRRYDAAMLDFVPPPELRLMVTPPAHMAVVECAIRSRTSRWEFHDRRAVRFAQVLYHPEHDSGVLMIAFEAPVVSGTWLVPMIALGAIGAAVVESAAVAIVALVLGLLLEAVRIRGRLGQRFTLREGLSDHLEAYTETPRSIADDRGSTTATPVGDPFPGPPTTTAEAP